MLSDKLKKYEAGESAAIAAEQRRYEKLSKTLNEMKLREEKQLSYEITLVSRDIVHCWWHSQLTR